MKVKSAAGCVSMPGLCCGALQGVCVCVFCERGCVCAARGHNAVDLGDFTHRSSRAGQIKQAGSQLELSGDSEKEVAVSC